jgi:hypothetical protein
MCSRRAFTRTVWLTLRLPAFFPLVAKKGSHLTDRDRGTGSRLLTATGPARRAYTQLAKGLVVWSRLRAGIQRQRLTQEMRSTAASDMTSPCLVSRRTHCANDSLRALGNGLVCRQPRRTSHASQAKTVDQVIVSVPIDPYLNKTGSSDDSAAA